MANLATISTLAVEGDWVLGDALNHASLIDGCMHAKARFMPYAHNNMDALEQQLRRAGTCRKLVIVDAVFSMDGDIADLPQTIELCKRYDARLMIDEAHSIGVLGTTGRGLAEHFDVPSRDIDIQMGTLSKAIPSFGGYIAGSRELIKALKFNARGWVFSGALPAPQLAAAIAAIQLIEAEPERVARLRKATSKYVVGLRENGFQIEHTETPIVPIHCSDEKMAFAFAQECKSEGLLFYPIVYPAVPADKPRVRTTMTAGHSDADIDFAVTAMTRAARRADLIA
jgi:glycine C-acetyltransferase